MATPELKPCPFCGGEAKMWNGLGTQADIRCKECDIGYEFQVIDYCPSEVRFTDGNDFSMETLSYPDVVKAYCIPELVEAWNTRTDATAPLVEVMRVAIYEITHLSPLRDDGSHKCIISKECLEGLRAALRPFVGGGDE